MQPSLARTRGTGGSSFRPGPESGKESDYDSGEAAGEHEEEEDWVAPGQRPTSAAIPALQVTSQLYASSCTG